MTTSELVRLPPYVDFRSPEDAEKYEALLTQALEKVNGSRNQK